MQGADPPDRSALRTGADADTAIRSAAVHDEHDSVRALLRHGAKLDLPVAAALGEETEFEHLPKVATPQDRHFALAFAAQFGYANIVRSLLDAGEDLDRYHPPGGHSHATPLHQAAAAGHEAVARAY
jgi:ankyrin repeat protein